MRLPRHLLLLAASLCAACSNDPVAPLPDADAIAAADRFQQLSNEAFATGADDDIVEAYRDIGRDLRRGGRVSPLTIAIDGVPMSFVGTAREVSRDAGPTCSQPGSLCLLPPPIRSVIAWQQDNPRRVVQLTSSAGTSEGARPIPDAQTQGFIDTPTLTYLDGAGGAYVGTGGTQQIRPPVSSDTPCYEAAPSSPSSILVVPRCTHAEFTASFNGTVAPPSFTVRNNSASGTHTIAMSAQPMHGSRLVLASDPNTCPGCTWPPDLMPAVNLRGDVLPSTLTIGVAGGNVDFALRVTNPFATPVTVNFNSGQQYDFLVVRANGTSVWTWSELMSFTSALTSRTIASGETVVFTVRWTPTERGTLFAEGWLTSSSHPARAMAGFVVP